MSAGLSQHGKKRSGERLGLSPAAAKRQAQRALERGIEPGQTSGGLRQWLADKQAAAGRPRVLRIYGEHVFIFGTDHVLITVLFLPREHRAAVAKIKARQ